MYLHHWYPYKLKLENDEPLCSWMNFENIPFQDPFFDETIVKARAANFHSTKFRPVSSLTVLQEWVNNINYVHPTAFIFHISRCGSTLLSQLLGMDEKTISLAEVPFFDDILRAPFKKKPLIPFSDTRPLGAAIRIYGQIRTGKERNLIIKNDSWHIFFREILRALYPEVPFILLYRKPDEVIRSHARLRGMHSVPGMIEHDVFGFSQKEVLQTDLNVYLARVLEKYYTEYLKSVKNDPRTLLLNYSEGAGTLLEKTLNFAKIETTGALKDQMLERCKYHSKYPEKTYKEELSNEAVPAFLNKALEKYNLLENLRLQQ